MFFTRILTAPQAASHLSEADQETWFCRLDMERANFTSALQWCQSTAEDVETGLRIASALAVYWKVRGFLSEGVQWLTHLLFLSPQAVTAIRADALNGLGNLLMHQGDFPAARSVQQENLHISRQLHDQRAIYNALLNLGSVAWFEGGLAEARTCYHECLKISEIIGNKLFIANALGNLGGVAWSEGDYAGARSFYEADLKIRRKLGDKQGIANTVGNLGEIILQVGGDGGSARNFLEESLALRCEIGDKRGMALVFDSMCEAAQRDGDFTRAWTLFRQSLIIYRDIHDMRGIIEAVEIFANLRIEADFGVQDACLLGAAEALREATRLSLGESGMEQYNKTIAGARQKLGRQAFERAWGNGRSMALEEVLAYMLTSSVRHGHE